MILTAVVQVWSLSVAFEVLIIVCQIDFINWSIFNCFTLHANLFIFNCQTSNLCFPKKYLSQVKQNKKTKEVEENGCLQTILVSDFKLAWENDDLLSSRHKNLLRYRTLCTSVLKSRFPKKGIRLTWFVLFEMLGVHQH